MLGSKSSVRQISVVVQSFRLQHQSLLDFFVWGLTVTAYHQSKDR